MSTYFINRYGPLTATVSRRFLSGGTVVGGERC